MIRNKYFLSYSLFHPIFNQSRVMYFTGIKKMVMFRILISLILLFSIVTPFSFAWGETIHLSPMREFSGLSKTDVLNLRKSAVEHSNIFKGISYIPDERIFQIEDGQPWISAYEITCFGVNTSEDIGKGLSRESVGILNPELLYNINIASYGFYNKTGCSEIDYLIPYKVFYNKASNTITSYIDYTSFFRKNKRFYGIVLEDANARDLGFNYGLADTTQNIRFKKNVNLSNSITPTQGFYHKGYSCGVSSGCNNYSPYESRYHFYLTKLPASIHIKLWRDFPAKESQPEDINYEIIFN